MDRRVWKIGKAGRIDRLRLEQETLDPPNRDCVRVRVRAVGLNFADIFALTGLYSATPRGPFIPGLEFSGVVTDIGRSASMPALAPGQHVMGCIRFGAYAELVDVPASQLQPIPTDWSFQQGAAFPVQTLTAWYALTELGAVMPGQRVLVHSAAGGVGLRALAICRAIGADTIATVSSQQKKAFLSGHGYEQVIVRDRDFAAQLDAMLSDRPLHLVLDAIGGRIQRQSFDALAPTGRIVVFGAAEFAPGRNRPRYFSSAWKFLTRPRYDPLRMMSSNRSVMAFNLIWLWDNTPLFARSMAEVMALDIPAPHVGRVFPFSEAPEAIEYLRSGESIGKVVLTLEAAPD